MWLFLFPLIEKENNTEHFFFKYLSCNLKTPSVEMACLLVIYIEMKADICVFCFICLCPEFNLWYFLTFPVIIIVIAFEYFICCGIFDVFQLELRSQKQQASSIVFENAFKLLLGNRSFKILITVQSRFSDNFAEDHFFST